jgi:hypothetical protein
VTWAGVSVAVSLPPASFLTSLNVMAWASEPLPRLADGDDYREMAGIRRICRGARQRDFKRTAGVANSDNRNSRPQQGDLQGKGLSLCSAFIRVNSVVDRSCVQVDNEMRTTYGQSVNAVC